jgi:2-amino-4-hydroxy-6-hydroxymethyldihydropteridine diphosphokinase
MYVVNQPQYLNAVAELHTFLRPCELLRSLQQIEKELGRVTVKERNVPRPIDLDIILYGTDTVKLPDRALTIPHPRLSERAFVLRPLCDIDESVVVPSDNVEIDGEPGLRFPTARQLLSRLNSNACDRPPGVCSGILRVTPLRSATSSLIEWDGRPKAMGIINMTPDSFSDGEQLSCISSVLRRVELFVRHGFDIVDVRHPWVTSKKIVVCTEVVWRVVRA